MVSEEIKKNHIDTQCGSYSKVNYTMLDKLLDKGMASRYDNFKNESFSPFPGPTKLSLCNLKIQRTEPLI